MRKLIACVLGAGFVLGAAPAFAGEWKLNPRACPDLVEDRRDRVEDRRDARVTVGRRDRVEDRRDRAENRRDEAVTICPTRAFYYVPDRREQKRNAQAGKNGRGKAYRQPNIRSALQWDRRMKMNFIRIDGRKIFVRG